MKSLKLMVAMFAFGTCLSVDAKIVADPCEKNKVEGIRVEDSALGKVPCVNPDVEKAVKELSQGRFGDLNKVACLGLNLLK